MQRDPLQRILIKNRITDPEFLPAALTAAHAVISSKPASLEDIRSCIRPPGLDSTRDHVSHTIRVAGDLGLFDVDDDERYAAAEDATSERLLKVACLRALTTPSPEIGNEGELSGTNITARFVTWFMHQDVLQEFSTAELSSLFSRALPEANKVANSTQINTIKRWVVWMGVAEPGSRRGSIRPSVTRALADTLPDLGATDDGPLSADRFIGLVLEAMPWLPEGQEGRALGARLGAPEIPDATTSDVLSVALVALEHLHLIELESADDADEQDAPWSLGGMGDARRPIFRVTVNGR